MGFWSRDTLKGPPQFPIIFFISLTEITKHCPVLSLPSYSLYGEEALGLQLLLIMLKTDVCLPADTLSPRGAGLGFCGRSVTQRVPPFYRRA